MHLLVLFSLWTSKKALPLKIYNTLIVKRQKQPIFSACVLPQMSQFPQWKRLCGGEAEVICSFLLPSESLSFSTLIPRASPVPSLSKGENTTLPQSATIVIKLTHLKSLKAQGFSFLLSGGSLKPKVMKMLTQPFTFKSHQGGEAVLQAAVKHFTASLLCSLGAEACRQA